MRGLRVEPAGFAYTEDFLDEATEEALLAFLAAADALGPARPVYFHRGL